MVDNFKDKDKEDINKLSGMFQATQILRSSIAKMYKDATGAGEGNYFNRIYAHLKEIIKTTESASESILMVAEDVNCAVDEITKISKNNPALKEKLDEINDRIILAFEACGFHDTIGQRLNLVNQLIQALEQRLEDMVNVWGEESIKKIKIELEKREGEKKYLHGPQNEKKAISQDDIDNMF